MIITTNDNNELFTIIKAKNELNATEKKIFHLNI